MPFVTTAIASSSLVHTGVRHCGAPCLDLLLTPSDGLDSIFKTRVNVNTIVAHPPTYQNYDNYLIPSLQAAYNFASDRSRIKAVILCNPHNPLSRCYPRESIVECMEFCQERGLHLIADEIHALSALKTSLDYAPAFTSALSLTEPLVPEGAVKVDPSRVHVVWSASKLFGSSGFRVVSPPNKRHFIFFVQSLTLSGMPCFTTESAAIVCNGNVDSIAHQQYRFTVPVVAAHLVTATYPTSS
jgi:aspartate/methionine/tyrosine aminotransferase